MKELLHHMLKNTELSVGKGRNYFTMSRGSFRYRKFIQWRRDLVQTALEYNENGFTLTFHDDKDNHDYFMDVKMHEGKYDVEMRNIAKGVNRFWITMPCGKNEHFYGCGETYSKFDLKGEKVRIFVAEHQNTNRISRKIVKDRIVGSDPEKDLPHDLLAGNAANRGIAGVNGNIPVIPHDKDFSLRHLIRQADVRVSIRYII